MKPRELTIRCSGADAAPEAKEILLSLFQSFLQRELKMTAPGQAGESAEGLNGCGGAENAV